MTANKATFSLLGVRAHASFTGMGICETRRSSIVDGLRGRIGEMYTPVPTDEAVLGEG